MPQPTVSGKLRRGDDACSTGGNGPGTAVPGAGSAGGCPGRAECEPHLFLGLEQGEEHDPDPEDQPP